MSALPSQSLPCNSIMLLSGPWSLGCLLLTLGFPRESLRPSLVPTGFLSPPLPFGPADLPGVALLGYTEHSQNTPSPPTSPCSLPHLGALSTPGSGMAPAQDPGSSCPCPHAERLLYLPRHAVPCCATPQGDLSPWPSPECMAPGLLRSQDEGRKPGEG